MPCLFRLAGILAVMIMKRGVETASPAREWGGETGRWLVGRTATLAGRLHYPQGRRELEADEQDPPLIKGLRISTRRRPHVPRRLRKLKICFDHVSWTASILLSIQRLRRNEL